MLILTRSQKNTYESKLHEMIQDYVLENYGHVLPEAVDMLERDCIHRDYLNPIQKGILITLTKKGFFEQKWSLFKGGTYFHRTQQLRPKTAKEDKKSKSLS